MLTRELSRRKVLQGGAALAALATFHTRGQASAFTRQPEAQRALGHRHAALAVAALAFPSQPGEEVVPWLDQPAPNPVPDVVGTQLVWEAAGFLDHPQRQVLHRPALQQARSSTAQRLAAEDRAAWSAAADAHAGRPRPARARRSPSPWSAPAITASPCSPAASATPPGRARRSRRCSRRRACCDAGHRGRLLGRRQRRGDGPRRERHRAVRAQHVAGGRDGSRTSCSATR